MKYFEKCGAQLSHKEYKDLLGDIKKDIRKKEKGSSTAKGALVGAAAGSIGSIITHPIDTLMVSHQGGKLPELMKELKATNLTGKVKRLMQGGGMKIGKNAIMGATILGINQLLNKQ